MRILVADDQDDVLESLRLLLKTEGFEIETVNSPGAVIESIQARVFDALLMDMNYARDTTSGSEGLQLLSRVQLLDPALPVVVMTAWGTMGLAIEAMRGGSCDFVEKPWDNNQLLNTLRRQSEKADARRKSRILDKEMDEAHEIQQRFLAAEVPEISGCDIQTSWQPSSRIGGDYFDAIELDDISIAFCIADVAGKGLPAALLMSNFQAMVRALSQGIRSPAELCGRLNRGLLGTTVAGRFVTMFYGVLNRVTGSMCYTTAGHVPPVIVRGDGSVTKLPEGGTVLGVFPNAVYGEAQVVLGAGDHLVLLTDGITEARNGQDDEFGQHRVVELLTENRKRSGRQLKQMLLDAVASFAAQGLDDDAAFMIVSRPGNFPIETNARS